MTDNYPDASKQSARSGLSLLRRFFVMLAVALMLACAFPPVRFPFVLPFAIAGLHMALSGVCVKEAFYLGFACGMAWFATGLFWLTSIFSQGAITLWAIAAAYPALYSALYVTLMRRFPKISLPLLAATLWTAIEYFRSEPTWPNFGFFGLGYALADSPIAIGASIIGTYGITFFIVLLGTLFAYALRLSFLRGDSDVERQIRAGSRRFALMLTVVWGALVYFPYKPSEPRNPLTAYLVQAMSEDEESLFRLSKPPANVRPDVILWPEYSFVHDPRKDQRRLWPQLENVARDNRCYFLFGAKQEDDPYNDATFRNTAFLLDPQGELVGTHVKNHPIHFIRDGSAGTEAKAKVTKIGKLGIAICFDLDFPDVTRKLVQDGAEVFLVPSDNPSEWGDVQHLQHRQMFQMRAIECGRWIATSDVAGNTFVVAPTGHIVARVRTSGDESLTAQVGRETGQTLYVRFGWLFGPLCLFVVVAALIVSSHLVKKRKTTDH
jgi:apolipoprotein N-acyltransferase